MKVSNNAIVWQGQSLFNDEPIIVLANGFNFENKNEKLGSSVVQIWVLPELVAPNVAVHTGEDAAICGNCPLRKDICYVIQGFAPLSMHKAYKRGKYKPLSHAQIQKGCDRKMILRLTGYGDVGAIDIKAPGLSDLIDAAHQVLAYTHAWNRRSDLKGRAMASVENVAGALKAQAKGWKTFRSKRPCDPLLPNEVLCPNQTDPARQCEDCLLCTGNKANVAINRHGSAKKVKKYDELFGNK